MDKLTIELKLKDMIIISVGEYKRLLANSELVKKDDSQYVAFSQYEDRPYSYHKSVTCNAADLKYFSKKFKIFIKKMF